MIMKLLGKQGNNRQGEYFLLGAKQQKSKHSCIGCISIPWISTSPIITLNFYPLRLLPSLSTTFGDYLIEMFRLADN